MSGIFLAIISAAIFGFQNAAARRAVVTATPLQGMVITVPTVVPMIAVICYFLGGFQVIQNWSYVTYLLAGAAGVMHFVIGRFCNYVSMQALGSTLSTPIQQLSTIFSLFFAVSLLNETLTGLNIVGVLLVSIGPALLISRRHSYSAKNTAGAFKPNLRRGVLYGLICVIGYGSSPILIVIALRSVQTMPNQMVVEPFAHSAAILLFSYVFAAVCVLVVAAIFYNFTFPKEMSRSGLKWFLLSGVLIAISQIFRYTAFALAPVSVVVPIQRISVIFRLLFNVYLNREYERIDAGIVITIILSVVGAIALGVNTEAVLSWFGAGQLITTVLGWQL